MFPSISWISMNRECFRKCGRRTLVVVGIILLFSLLLLATHQLVLPGIAYFLPALYPAFYDLAVYGAYPTKSYQTFKLQSPAALQVRWVDSCNDGLILLTPNGPAVADVGGKGPMIIDARGNLVWMTVDYGVAINLKVQQYKGENYITFWAGHKQGSMGIGSYFMLDAKYNVFKTLAAAGEGLFGDIHEFIITDEGTALITVYTPANANLEAFDRPQNAWIVDSVFQEIDIETGSLVFEWRASEHFAATDSFYKDPFGGYRESHPYDFFHLNSIAKDKKGNYLISSRHLHMLACISPKGETLWVLGGPHNEFEDLSGGEATGFTWQHDARWIDEEAGVISFFDNESASPIMVDAHHSAGKIVQLNLEKKTAKLLHSYVSLNKILAASQGSLQVLPKNDHVLVGWGSGAAFSEFKRDGELVCETHIAAEWTFWWERVKSYRTIKTFDWVGRPDYPPSTAMSGDKLFVSWNGATEIVTWQLEGKPQNHATESEFENVDIIEKDGFESSFTLPSAGTYDSYRVAALDNDGNVLKYSEEIKHAEPSILPALFQLVLFGCVYVGMAIIAWFLIRKLIPNGEPRLFDWATRHGYSKLQ